MGMGMEGGFYYVQPRRLRKVCVSGVAVEVGWMDGGEYVPGDDSGDTDGFWGGHGGGGDRTGGRSGIMAW